jgi:hypothetical protein
MMVVCRVFFPGKTTARADSDGFGAFMIYEAPAYRGGTFVLEGEESVDESPPSRFFFAGRAPRPRVKTGLIRSDDR